MGFEIYKEAPDVDYYIIWNSEYDAPAWGGTREELIPFLFDLDDRKPDRIRETDPSHPENRAKRADEYGSSAMWGRPRNGGWDDPTMTYRDSNVQGGCTRASMFVIARRLDEDENADVSDLVEPFDG